MDRRKFSLFVSSTYEDLKEERQAIFGVALESNFIPVGMEQFHAAPASQWNVITRMIDECDFYLLMIGGRYGSIDEETGKSYTEKEYDYAKEKGLPVLVFVRKEDAITSDKMDNEDKYNRQEKLDFFRSRVMNEGNTVDFFSDVDSLKYSVSQSFNKAISYADRDAGWVRYRDVVDFANDTIEEKSVSNSKQQRTLLDNMSKMLLEFGEKIQEIEKNQLSLKEIPVITASDIDSLFNVDNETLYIGKNSSFKEDFSPIKPTASVMLFFAAEGNGEILDSIDLNGRSFQAGNNPLNADHSRREAAKWEDAIDILLDEGFIKLVIDNNFDKMYSVTEKGYQLNEKLKEDSRYDVSRAPSEILEDIQKGI